jgi:hypothetical protein
MPVTYDKIATTTLASNQSTVNFSSISGSYTDLIVVSSYAFDTANQDFRLRVGSSNTIDTNTNYSFTFASAQGSSASSDRNQNTNYFAGYRLIGGSTGRQVAIHQINNYANTTTYKTVLIRNNDAGVELNMGVGLWRSTNAINTIEFYFASSAKFVSGSTFTLYGILKA